MSTAQPLARSTKIKIRSHNRIVHKMKRGRKSSTKPEVASDGNKPKKVKSSDEGKSNDAQGYIASLPLHGEYLPSKGYSIVPAAVTETRQSLVEVFQMVRNQKRQGDKVRVQF